MCIICVKIDKNELPPWEVLDNLQEISKFTDKEHLEEIKQKIKQKTAESEFKILLEKCK